MKGRGKTVRGNRIIWQLQIQADDAFSGKITAKGNKTMKNIPRTVPTGGAENRIIKTATKQQAACLKRRAGRWNPDGPDDNHKYGKGIQNYNGFLFRTDRRYL